MAKTRTEEDWFLRGGAKPQPTESVKGKKDGVELTVCQNCGGMNLAEETECTHCGASLTGGCPTGEYCGADYGEFPPDSPHESDACNMCDGHHHCDECPHLTDGEDDDDEDGLQDWIVTMSRTKTVQQTAKVRVKAHSEEEAMDLLEDRAEDEAVNWPWEDDDDTEEFEDTEAIEAEVAR